jgi:hypothetical protein
VITNRRRDSLMAAVVALSLVFYCLYAVFLDLTYRESGRLMADMELPCDIVVHVPSGMSENQLETVRGLYFLTVSEPALLAAAASSAGIVDVLLVGPDSRALSGLGTVLEGRLPGAGECLLPASYRERGGFQLGDRLALRGVGLPGGRGAADLPAGSSVAGFFQPADPWFDLPVAVVDGPALAAAGRANLVFAWCAHPETFTVRAVRWLENYLAPDEMPVPYLAQRPVMPLVMTAATARELGRQLQRAVYFPAGEAMFLLYIFFGVGLFTLMLLSFLDRRREYAVMKTLGLTSAQIGLVLYLEVLAVGLAGVAAGAGTTLAALGVVRHAAGLDLRLSGWILVSAGVFGFLVLIVSVWFPIGLARLATVANLLGGQPFRPFGDRRRWSEGQDATARKWSAAGPRSPGA